MVFVTKRDKYLCYRTAGIMAVKFVTKRIEINLETFLILGAGPYILGGPYIRGCVSMENFQLDIQEFM